jgi:acetyl esterase/lipase
MQSHHYSRGRPADPRLSTFTQDHLPSLLLTAIPSHTRHFPSRANPYFSPALTPSGGWAFLVKHGVRVYVSTGSVEGMYDEIMALQRGMERDGVDVELRVVSGDSGLYDGGSPHLASPTPT